MKKLKTALKKLSFIVFGVSGTCAVILMGMAITDASYDTHYTQQYSYWLVIGYHIWYFWNIYDFVTSNNKEMALIFYPSSY